MTAINCSEIDYERLKSAFESTEEYGIVRKSSQGIDLPSDVDMRIEKLTGELVVAKNTGASQEKQMLLKYRIESLRFVQAAQFMFKQIQAMIDSMHHNLKR